MFRIHNQQDLMPLLDGDKRGREDSRMLPRCLQGSRSVSGGTGGEEENLILSQVAFESLTTPGDIHLAGKYGQG